MAESTLASVAGTAGFVEALPNLENDLNPVHRKPVTTALTHELGHFAPSTFTFYLMVNDWALPVAAA